MIVSPRDMVFLYKVFRVNEKEIYICGKSISLHSHPNKTNIMRAEAPRTCWIVKQINEKMCKVTFISEMDFRISSYIQRQIAPKYGNLAL